MISLNTQPREKPDYRQDGMLDVVSIFSSVQGEGPLVGMPSLFFRLAGCPLDCTFCDADYTTNRQMKSVHDLLHEAFCFPPNRLIVITGGEPLRQNIGPFIHLLLNHNYEVQIETNGTLYCKEVPYGRITTVCSPKTPKLHPDLEPHIDAYKYIIEAGQVDEEDGLPLSALGMKVRVARPRAGFDKSQVYLQPCDEQDEEKNKLNIKATLDSCFKHSYRYSHQLHKVLGLE